MRLGDPSDQSAMPAGSPSEGEPVFLVVGKLRRPHGVLGEILMDVVTDFPERLASGVTVFIGNDHQPFHITSCRWHQDCLLIAFQEIRDREEAGALRNSLVYVRADEIPPLEDGEYYHHELIGLEVREETGAYFGVVTGILETGANDILVVTLQNGAEVLLPITDEVILNVNLKDGEVLVHLLPGLLLDE
jgi:16S rRNA processing protein RimM